MRQIKLRASRIGEFNDQLLLLCETNLELIRSTIESTKPETVIIDSLLTMYNEEVSSAQGSVSTMRRYLLLKEVFPRFGNPQEFSCRLPKEWEYPCLL